MTDKPNSYEGFNEYNPLLDTDVSLKTSYYNKVISSTFFSKSLKYDTDLQQAVLKTSHGRRAPPVVFIYSLNIQNISISFRPVKPVQLLLKR